MSQIEKNKIIKSKIMIDSEIKFLKNEINETLADLEKLKTISNLLNNELTNLKKASNFTNAFAESQTITPNTSKSRLKINICNKHKSELKELNKYDTEKRDLIFKNFPQTKNFLEFVSRLNEVLQEKNKL